jgi:large subunit ribosomal protein L35
LRRSGGAAITPATGRHGLKGMPIRPELSSRSNRGKKMPKLKTKSSAKKRFRLTAKGKVRMNQSGKQHGMIKRTNKQLRNQRGTTIMSASDAKVVKKFLPYG